MRKIMAYYLIDKGTKKVTFGPLESRQQARAFKKRDEQILQLVAEKVVR